MPHLQLQLCRMRHKRKGNPVSCILNLLKDERMPKSIIIIKKRGSYQATESRAKRRKHPVPTLGSAELHEHYGPTPARRRCRALPRISGPHSHHTNTRAHPELWDTHAKSCLQQHNTGFSICSNLNRLWGKTKTRREFTHSSLFESIAPYHGKALRKKPHFLFANDHQTNPEENCSCHPPSFIWNTNGKT